jgi:hypothetical protein
MVKKEILAIGCGSVVLLVCVGGMVAVMAGPLVLDLAKEVMAQDLGMSEARTAESERRGDVIVEALQAHKARHGRFPATLDDLAPDLLPAIQKPTAGTGEWEYRTFDSGQGFQLMFGEGADMYPSHSISSRRLEIGWYRDY